MPHTKCKDARPLTLYMHDQLELEQGSQTHGNESNSKGEDGWGGGRGKAKYGYQSNPNRGPRHRTLQSRGESPRGSCHTIPFSPVQVSTQSNHRLHG